MLQVNPAEFRRPASGNQARYVKAELAGAGTYMIPMGHLVQGPLDRARLRFAADSLVRRHDALRTRFEINDGQVAALITPEAEFCFDLLELSDRDFASWLRITGIAGASPSPRITQLPMASRVAS